MHFSQQRKLRNTLRQAQTGTTGPELAAGGPTGLLQAEKHLLRLSSERMAFLPAVNDVKPPLPFIVLPFPQTKS